MTQERHAHVNLAPSLEDRVHSSPDALICLSGLAYMTAIMIDSGKLPDFKKSLSIQLVEFFERANKLTESDIGDQTELDRVIQTSSIWTDVSEDTWEDLGVVRYSHLHTKVNIRRDAENLSTFTLNIGPFG